MNKKGAGTALVHVSISKKKSGGILSDGDDEVEAPAPDPNQIGILLFNYLFKRKNFF